MRYQPLPAAFHTDRRHQLRQALPAGAVAMIDTNAQLARSRDTNMPFRPDSYFYYLTGIDQAGAVLVLTKTDEWLFVTETNEQTRLWDGDSYNQAEAAQLSGVTKVQWAQELPEVQNRLLAEAAAVYLNCAELPAKDPAYQPAVQRRTQLKRRFSKLPVKSIRPILAPLRMVKQPAELVQMRRAAAITMAGFAHLQDLAQPGRHEYEIEAELTAAFLRQGANGHAYEPIVASGPGATTLHYIRNDRQLQAGELLLVDAGAEYGWYAADVTRTVAVGGAMTTRQQAVHDAVYEVQQAGIALMRPGALMADIEHQIGEMMTKQVAKLGLTGSYRQYFPHATSHFMGLDVHDVGDYQLPLAPGMVLTCEPGLYLAEEGIGVRIEDDILVTPDGPESLTQE
jgi:Xaa-Pro aminopeptidase